MAYSEGQLNGTADFRVGIAISYVGSNWGGNFSTFYWEVALQNPSGSPTWMEATQYWYASIGGQYREGTFNIPSSQAGQRTKIVASGYVDIGHDGEGYRPGFASDAYIRSGHRSIGEGGSGQAWIDAPRIPKPPTAPRDLRMTTQTTTNLGVTYIGPADDRGARVEQYQAEWFEITPDGRNPRIWDDLNSMGYTSPSDGRAGPILKPSTEYHVYIRARNAAGWGAKAGPISMRTLSGVLVSNGSAWEAVGLYANDGGSNNPVVPQISDGVHWYVPQPQPVGPPS